METTTCRLCGIAFEPRRTTQKYCSPTCSRRHRDREWRNRHHADTTQTLRAQLESAVIENRVILEVTMAKFQMQLDAAERKARDRLTFQANRNERETDVLRTRLRDLASINVEIACEVPELKAQITELQLENARLIHGQRADFQELTQIAGRLMELCSRLGLPLDKATKEIFQRRGWQTSILVPEQ
ncbi:hypothetical protein [Arthrobacter antibioticus]|uniref:hypothetical protein n=1 Tax=Arthrobacter sp. H35-MC1 TaxID=3046203 RepID=UPI0024BB7C35|nr:hypothetical protein [Arthrobacter sp. H35-MC1]MDJ0318386.1 hypothetical protein [Arthrobacter sp. H35-MC1]